MTSSLMWWRDSWNICQIDISPHTWKQTHSQTWILSVIQKISRNTMQSVALVQRRNSQTTISPLTVLQTSNGPKMDTIIFSVSSTCHMITRWLPKSCVNSKEYSHDNIYLVLLPRFSDIYITISSFDSTGPDILFLALQSKWLHCWDVIKCNPLIN